MNCCRSVLNLTICLVIHFHTNDLPFRKEPKLESVSFSFKPRISSKEMRQELICSEWMGFDRGLFHKSLLSQLCHNTIRKTIKEWASKHLTSDSALIQNCIGDKTCQNLYVLLISWNKFEKHSGRSMLIFTPLFFFFSTSWGRMSPN